MKTRFINILLFTLSITFFSIFSVYGEAISVEELLSKLNEAEHSFNDYSCKFVTIVGETGTMAKFSAIVKKSIGQSLPTETEIFMWIKKPYLMKTKELYAEKIFKKEGDDFYGYSWYPQNNTLDKVKLPRNSWPAYPSPESGLAMLKGLLEKASSHNIEKNDNGYVITVNLSNLNRKDVFYINDTNWMIYKHLVYENDKLSLTEEWRDIHLDTGLSDNSFELQVPKDAKKTTRDLTKPQ